MSSTTQRIVATWRVSVDASVRSSTPWVSRKVISSMFKRRGKAVPEALFHYRNGRPIGTAREDQGAAHPLFRFLGGPDHIGLVALGEPQADLLLATVPALNKLARECLGIKVRAEFRMDEVDMLVLAKDERPFTYQVSNLIVRTDRKKWQELFAEDYPAHDEIRALQSIIRRGIVQQAAALDLEHLLPEEDQLEVRVLQHDLKEITPTVERRAKGNAEAPQRAEGEGDGFNNALAKSDIYYHRVTFATPLILRGHWAAGGFKNRGYGAIYPFGQHAREQTRRYA